MTKQFIPFSNGSQAEDWFTANCDRCTKKETCGLIVILQTAGFVADGRITKETAKAIGYLDNKGKYCWPCNEVCWTEEWKAEFTRRKGQVA